MHVKLFHYILMLSLQLMSTGILPSASASSTLHNVFSTPSKAEKQLPYVIVTEPDTIVALPTSQCQDDYNHRTATWCATTTTPDPILKEGPIAKLWDWHM